jgi:hypothetical protein
VFGGFLVYARFLLDPDEYIRTRPLELTQELGNEKLRAMTAELAERYHHGEGPCFRYAFDVVADDRKLEALADEVVAAGLAESLVDMFGLYSQWNKEHEEQFHEEDQAAEAFDMLFVGMGFFEQVVVFLGRDRLIEAARRYETEVTKKFLGESTRVLGSMPEAKQKLVRTIWERCQECTTFKAFMRLTDMANRKITQARLDRLALELEAWGAMNGSFPERLAELREAGLDPATLQDGWKFDFHYERVHEEQRAVIRSLGADFTPGGEGLSEDLEQSVVLGE